MIKKDFFYSFCNYSVLPGEKTGRSKYLGYVSKTLWSVNCEEIQYPDYHAPS
jgi:hypothetical protein